MAALAASGVAFAQEQTEASSGGVGAGVSSFGLGDWVGLGARLALVVLVIWLAVAGMRWYVRRVHQGGRSGSLGALEVIETHALGPNRTLHLVRLGDRAVLVGATPERITSLLTVDDPDELKRLVDRPEEAAPRRVAAGGLASLVSSFRTGLVALVALNARRREVDARARQRRGAVESAAPKADRVPRFAGLRAAFARTTARPAPRPTRRREAVVEEPESRQSLFDRTLASIDAVEVRGVRSAPTAAGLRARSGYGQASPSAGAAGTGSGGVSRDRQIADLQRAIAAARRNAG